MCITKREQWVYGGKSYDDEIDAVKAALTDLGTRFVKEFHNKPLDGMIELGSDVSELRIRYLELTCGTTQVEEVPSKKAPGEPLSGPAGGDPDDPTSATNMLTRFYKIPDYSPIFDSLVVWMKKHHFRNIEHACQNARDNERLELSRLIGLYIEPAREDRGPMSGRIMGA